MPGKRMRAIFTSRQAIHVKRFKRIVWGGGGGGTYSVESDCNTFV